MAKKKLGSKSSDDPDAKGNRAAKATTPESEFIRELAEQEIAHVTDFQQELLDVLARARERPTAVRDLFKGYRRHSRQHEFLQSLREHGIARPQGGGTWAADDLIVLTRKGLELARSCNVKTHPLVFVSYSRKDQVWRDRFVEHLSVLEQSFNLDVWYDNRVGIGGDWFAEIKDALERSVAAVLLISASFLTSDFIKHEEIPQILGRAEDSLHVFPILVRPCAWQTVDWLNPRDEIEQSFLIEATGAGSIL